MKPTYKSVVRVVIEKDNPNVVSFEEIMALEASDTDFYQTQYEIIQSRTIAKDVAQRLDLYHNKVFFPEKLIDISAFISYINIFEMKTKKKVPDSILLNKNCSENMKNALDVSPVKNSRVVDISVVTTDPATIRHNGQHLCPGIY